MIYYFDIKRDKCIINKKRSMNRYVSVHELLLDGQFKFIGEDWANSASFKGEKAMAAQILADKLNYTLDSGGYYITDPDITLIELP